MSILESRNQAYRLDVNESLERYLSAGSIQPRLLEAMSYSLLHGGKRLRPCLLLAAAQLTGGDVKSAMPLACAVEMIHTYSLIHDDLPAMDNDDLRRGKPSCHRAFGEGQAILAGDGLLSYAFQIMAEALICETGRGLRTARAVAAVAEGAGVFGMVSGQTADLICQQTGSANASQLSYIHERKTGAMIKASILAGAHMGDPAPRDLTGLCSYGAHLGLLFQITDDILDIVGDGASMGKTLGKDIAAGKLTYPGLYGLEEAKRMASVTVEKAHAALNGIERAEYFHELADAVLTRKK